MELESTADESTAKARERFRVELARIKKLTVDLEDPDKLAELEALPPHMLSRY